MSRAHRSAPLARALALLALAGCADRAQRPTFELRAVVAERLAEWQAQVAPAEPPAAPDAARDENVAALLAMHADGNETFKRAALADLADLGDAALPALARTLAHPERRDGERIAASAALGAIGTRAAADVLLAQMTNAPESWVRAHCAWQLAVADRDHVVPVLCLRLKYETDHETVVWMARTLAHFGNYSGLEGLTAVRDQGADESVRGLAARTLDEVAAASGLDGGLAELWTLWFGGDPEGRLPAREPSADHRLALWRTVESLSGEHFQLRGVDDARFMLSRGASFVAAILAEALHDEDVYVRVHTAQCLERMGPRAAAAAGPELVLALSEPALAPEAAAALGAIAYPRAEEALLAALESRGGAPLELRVAAARALGRLRLPAAEPALRAVANSTGEALDLRQAAAEALAANGTPGEAPLLLVAIFEGTADGGDRDGAERALEEWLVAAGDAGDARAAAALASWRAAAGPPGIIPSPGEIEARRAARLEALRSCLD